MLIEEDHKIIGILTRYDAKTGAVKWSKNLVKDFGGREPMHGDNGSNQGWGYSGSPLIEIGTSPAPNT